MPFNLTSISKKDYKQIFQIASSNKIINLSPNIKALKGNVLFESLPQSVIDNLGKFKNKFGKPSIKDFGANLEIILRIITPKEADRMNILHDLRVVEVVKKGKNEKSIKKVFKMKAEVLQQHVNNTPAEYDSVLFRFGASDQANGFELYLYLGYANSINKNISANFTPYDSPQLSNGNIEFNNYSSRIVDLVGTGLYFINIEKEGIIHTKDSFEPFFKEIKNPNQPIYIHTAQDDFFGYSTLILSNSPQIKQDNSVYFDRGGSCCPPAY